MDLESVLCLQTRVTSGASTHASRQNRRQPRRRDRPRRIPKPVSGHGSRFWDEEQTGTGTTGPTSRLSMFGQRTYLKISGFLPESFCLFKAADPSSRSHDVGRAIVSPRVNSHTSDELLKAELDGLSMGVCSYLSL